MELKIKGIPAINFSKNRADDTTGFPGVTKSGDKWIARCMVNGKRTYVGIFDTPEEANAEIQIRKDK